MTRIGEDKANQGLARVSQGGIGKIGHDEIGQGGG